MNTTLRDFIAGRKAEIKLQLKELKREWRELQAAESAIATDDSESDGAEGNTIKEMILQVLAEHQTCADAHQIIEMIRKRFNVEIARTSISPQLSRLRKEKRLHMENKLWCLTNQSAPKNETPDVVASDVSEDVNPLS